MARRLHAFIAFAAGGALVSCGQISLSPLHAASSASDGSRFGRGREHPAWISRTAKARDLLYVSSHDSSQVGYSDVFVFDYPAGELRGRLTGFTQPGGLCVDAAQDVFVTDYAESETIEYRHGDAVPTATLEDTGAFPGGCSVDPTSGALAVSNVYGTGNNASIEIYPHAKAPPTTYTDPSLFNITACAYDDSGNLFVDGLDHNLRSGFGELSKGSTAFVTIALPSRIKLYGPLAWDGRFVTIVDGSTGFLYRLKVAGSRATAPGTTKLLGVNGLGQYTIVSSSSSKRGASSLFLVGPNYNSGNAAFWNYPRGGNPTKTLGFIDQPLGAIVSRRTHR